jgi:hypothetical protein
MFDLVGRDVRGIPLFLPCVTAKAPAYSLLPLLAALLQFAVRAEALLLLALHPTARALSLPSLSPLPHGMQGSDCSTTEEGIPCALRHGSPTEQPYIALSRDGCSLSFFCPMGIITISFLLNNLKN